MSSSTLLSASIVYKTLICSGEVWSMAVGVRYSLVWRVWIETILAAAQGHLYSPPEGTNLQLCIQGKFIVFRQLRIIFIMKKVPSVFFKS